MFALWKRQGGLLREMLSRINRAKCRAAIKERHKRTKKKAIKLWREGEKNDREN